VDFSSPAIVAIAAVVGTPVLARLYLTRLDRRERFAPEKKRAAIAASRRRGRGHLWVGGAIVATIALFAVLLGTNRPAFGLLVALLVVALIAFVIVAVRMAGREYREAGKMRASRHYGARWR
jgi:hypothetical protein